MCETCKGTHFVPFVKADGSVSQYARQTCPDCGGYDHERDYADVNMPARHPDDFDFPMSYEMRSFYEEQATGKALTPIQPAQRTREPSEVEVVVKHVSVYDFAGKRQVAKLYRIEEDVKSLGTQIKSLRAEKKKRDDNYEPF